MRSILTLLLLPCIANATPNTFTTSGRLLDANGTPVHATHDLQVSLYTALGAPSATDAFTLSTVFSDGYYSASIGPIDSEAYPDGMWMGVAIDGGAEMQRTAVASVPYAMQVDRTWNGIRLDGEGVVNVTTTGGSVVLDSSAHGGEVRRTAGGDSGRVFGVQAPPNRQPFTAVPSTVTLRAKVSDNSSTGNFGYFSCTGYRDGAWSTLDTTGDMSPARFAASDTWQDFTLYCPWDWTHTIQFVGWDAFADVGAELSIDYVHIVPGASRPGPQRWRAAQSADLVTSGTGRVDMPGLVDIPFVLDAPSSVQISYGAQVHNLHDYTDQHCAVHMYLDGSSTPIADTGNHGSGFIMPGSQDGSDRQKWWDFAVLEETVTLPPGRHTLTIRGSVSSGANSCRFAKDYNGGHLTIEAFPE